VIGSLRGTLLERWPSGEVLIDVAGVGYRVTVSPATALDLGDAGREVFVYVHHHRREDAETLYGFLSGDERLAFEALLGAHGVGPSLALAILSVHPPAALQRVLAADDLASLCLVPGVGKKTAARLLVELKSRLDIPGLDTAATADRADGLSAVPGGSPHADVRDALANLGYGNEEVAAVLRELPDQADDSAELLRIALQKLAVA
jgi:holliday junction DNA helicase RuvA